MISSNTYIPLHILTVVTKQMAHQSMQWGSNPNHNHQLAEELFPVEENKVVSSNHSFRDLPIKGCQEICSQESPGHFPDCEAPFWTTPLGLQGGPKVFIS